MNETEKLLAALSGKMDTILQNQADLGTRVATLETSETRQVPSVPVEPASAVQHAGTRDDDIARGAQSACIPGLEDEAAKFSFAKAIYAQHSGDWSFAGFEKEVMRAAGSTFERVDPRAPIEHQLAAGSGAGSHLVPTEVMNLVIPLIRDKMVLDRLGVTTLNLRGRGKSFKLPKHTGSTTGYWLGENSEITASTLSTGETEITPKKAAILTKYSGNMIREGTVVGIEDFVRNDLATKLALHIQAGFLEGLGSSYQPTGVFVNSDVTSVAINSNTNATILTKLQQMVEELEVAIGNLAVGGEARWLMNPRAKHRIGRILYGGTTGGPILSGPYGGDWRVSADNLLLGYEVVSTGAVSNTNQASSLPDTSDIMLAYWSEVIFALWGAMELMASPVAGTAFEYDQIWVRGIQEVDVAYQHADTLIKGTDLNLNVASSGSA